MRCDLCDQPCIGTALCPECARVYEEYVTEQNTNYWEGDTA